MVSSLPTQSEQPKRRSNDPISWYLQNIGRVPLLTPAEEIELGNQVQKMMILTEDGQLNEKINDFTSQQKRTIKIGRRAKERMMKANLRLVVSVAKKYQGKGLELLDLVQEGSLGLERAVEKFDPTRGYKFSTYAFWWIRQSMTRAIACQSRTIRLPVHLSERLASGPGLVTKTFSIDTSFNSLEVLNNDSLWISQRDLILEGKDVIQTTRIGISKAKNIKWRWYLKNTRSVSKRVKGDRTPKFQ